eukprot:3878234-Prymnesium_polylepis.2
MRQPQRSYAKSRLAKQLGCVCVFYGSTGTADANRVRVQGRANDATVPRAYMYFSQHIMHSAGNPRSDCRGLAA